MHEPRNVNHACQGQIEVDPGVIVMGYKGDPVYDDPKSPHRPAWTKDGSMMVFRKLEQDVGGFTEYCNTWGPKWREFTPVPDEVKPALTDTEGAEFFGALLVGRWKSVSLPVVTSHWLTLAAGNASCLGSFQRRQIHWQRPGKDE